MSVPIRIRAELDRSEYRLIVRALKEMRERGEISRDDDDALVNLLDYLENGIAP